MENNHNGKVGFSYTYSAKEQAEIRRIREKYENPTETEDKMMRLRRLDAGVKGAAEATALVFGIVGMLILGFGMSLCLTDLGGALGLFGMLAMVVGIPLGLFGGALAGFAYPVYVATLKRKREKVAPEILRLTDELLK